MSEWSLSLEEYEVLLAYVGCGNFPNADIIVYGNEEGTGGYSVEANVKARVKYFGRDQINGNYISCIDEKCWENGFYEKSASGGGRKVEQFLLPHENIQQNGFTGGVFNQALARICLQLEEKDKNNFFQSKLDNEVAWSLINSFIVNDLYISRNGIQTALADWRPLPRSIESKWPPQYKLIADSLKPNPYLNVFNNPKGREKKTDVSAFRDFRKDMERRLDILKNLFITSKSRVIIGIGGSGGFKKASLEKMFGQNIFTPLTFDTVEMVTTRGFEIKSYSACIQLEHKDLHIFLIPFPTPGNVFKTQKDSLGMLSELTNRYLKPLI